MWYLWDRLSQWCAFPGSLLIQVVGGICQAGFNLSASNFIYDTVEPKLRLPLISYHDAMKGVAILAGGLIGGWLTGIDQNFGPLFPGGFS